MKGCASNSIWHVTNKYELEFDRELPRCLLSLMFFFCLTMPSVLFADDIELAKAKLTEAREMIEKYDYKRALDAFQKSYDLQPKLSVLFNIGMCYKALFRYSEAIETFGKCVRNSAADGEIKELASAAMKELLPLVARLRITNAPDGAQVFIDDREAGVTPIGESLLLDPGSHTVKVTKAGYRSLETRIEAAADVEEEISAQLAIIPGQLRVECQGNSTVVQLDGKTAGPCPYASELEPGHHEVWVKAPRRKDFHKRIRVVADKEIVVSVGTLTPIDDAPADKKSLLPFLISGIAAAVVGAGVLGGVGGYYTYKWDEDFHDALDKKDIAEEECYIGDDKNDCTQIGDFITAREETENNIPGMAIGYSVGGVLLITGATLLAIWGISKERGDSAAVALEYGGFVLRF